MTVEFVLAVAVVVGSAPEEVGKPGYGVVISLLAAWAAASASCCLRAIPARSMVCWDDEESTLL